MADRLSKLRRGLVLDSNGLPVEDAVVTIEWGTAPMPEIALITDANGRFQLDLPAGHFRLRAQTASGVIGTALVDGAPSTSAMIIHLPPA